MKDKSEWIAVLCGFCGSLSVWDMPPGFKGLVVNLCGSCNVLTPTNKKKVAVFLQTKDVARRNLPGNVYADLIPLGAYHISAVKQWQHGTDIELKEFSGNRWFRPKFNHMYFVPEGYVAPTAEHLAEQKTAQAQLQADIDRPYLNAEGEPMRVCLDCRINHTENCRTCLGFGLYEGKSGQVPASASDAHDGEKKSDRQGRVYLACPECKGTLQGVPAYRKGGLK